MMEQGTKISWWLKKNVSIPRASDQECVFCIFWLHKRYCWKIKAALNCSILYCVFIMAISFSYTIIGTKSSTVVNFFGQQLQFLIIISRWWSSQKFCFVFQKKSIIKVDAPKLVSHKEIAQSEGYPKIPNFWISENVSRVMFWKVWKSRFKKLQN